MLAKLGGAKAALAGVTAVTTVGLAGGAAGVLPPPAQSLVASVVNSATPFEFPSGDDVTAIVQHGVGSLPPVSVPGGPAAPPVSAAASASAGAGSTSGSGSAAVQPPAVPAAPAVVPPVPGVPALPPMTVPPAVAGLVRGLPACVANLVPTGGGVADPARLATQIPACIPQILGAANLPPQVATCVASVLGAIGGASGMSAAGVPTLNVSSCVPLDSTKCVSGVLGLLATMPGAGSLPGLSTVPGCVPMNVTACITSITGAVSAGATPRFDLSACMPTTAGLPGTGSLPGVGSLPGLSGALPFFGR